MVGPHGHGERSNGDCRVHQGLVTKDRFPTKDREDFGHDSKERQSDDVHLGVSEEPEEVLPQNCPSVGGVINVGAKDSVRAQCEHGRGQHGEGQQHED